MKKSKNKDVIKLPGGVFQDLANQFKLILRLVADSRISPFLKILPFGTLFYFIIFPDLAPGPIDDALVIGIGTYMFIELCPPEIVKEHKDALENVISADWRDKEDEDDRLDEDKIEDAEFRES